MITVMAIDDDSVRHGLMRVPLRLLFEGYLAKTVFPH